MDDGPSSLKKWKNEFFLIDRRARLCARLIYLCDMREEVLVRFGLSSVWFNKECDSVFQRIDDNVGDAKVAKESHHLFFPLLERVSSHTTASETEGAMISLPTPDEIAASLLDPRLAKNRPSKKRKLKKGALKDSSSAPEPGQAEGINKADLTDFCGEIKNSLERDGGTSTMAASAPTPRLGKRLGDPPSMAVVSASGPSHVGTSVNASTSGRIFSLGGAAVSGHAWKSGAEIVRRQMDPLDSLARSALAYDVKYDQILKDDFGTDTRGEEIDLTLFPLAPGPYQMSYPYEGLVTARNRLQEKFDWKDGYVKVICSKVMTLDGKLERMQKDSDALGQENRELRLQKDVLLIR
ncbi:hypothetical protein Tco_1028924 [Tanacetum coccineum]|uniref:Uncharacterized protein n=1 Tax=Tanacetum coccineum TaxID=301880 RepID=A0ABQ5G3H5_9ASTR